MVWGGSTHRIISARQDAFVRSQPGQIKLEILRFQKRRRMGNGNGTLVRLLRLHPLCCCALNMNAKWIVNRGVGGRTYADHGWVGLWGPFEAMRGVRSGAEVWNVSQAQQHGMCKSCNCSCCLSPPPLAPLCLWPNNSMKLAKSSSSLSPSLSP